MASTEDVATDISPLEAPRERGRLKVFLGMVAGVGKTYRMLQGGHAAWEAGEDVVIGLLETHGRVDTQRLADGLPIIRRRRIGYRATELEEMDLPAILARAPQLCLIDELAHTNVPGVEHAKRYDDVETVRDAGIDVMSTLNVQHLESLNDRVAELSGVRVRETIPDAVLATADEVVLIDLNPEALLERLRAGKIYPAERVDTALNNFLRIENLAALRELALRQVAQEVEAKRLTRETVGSRGDTLARDTPQAVGERLLALVEPTPGSQRLVRRACRSAHGRQPRADRPRPVRKILLPFTGQAIPRRAFEAAVRLAKAENATIMPAFLVPIPLNLPLDAAMPQQCQKGMPLLEAIEQRARGQGIEVDARVSRGRSYRDALRRLLATEHFDRIIVSAAEAPQTGLRADDLDWLLKRVPAEILILRPAPEDTRRISADGVAGHF